jgi:hypothetical protein
MGKLHTLRRDIERDPEVWLIRSFLDKRVIGVKAAYRTKNGRWKTSAFGRSYKKFVESTLKELGKLPG